MTAEKLVFVDVETTGPDPSWHAVWEIAHATETGPVESSIVAHTLDTALADVLKGNGWRDRAFAGFDPVAAMEFEAELKKELEGATLVAANPAHVAAFLSARWGEAPWHYRLLDVETYAMGALGWKTPRALKDVRRALLDLGIEVPAPDHSAPADVATLRACYFALSALYGVDPEDEEGAE